MEVIKNAGFPGVELYIRNCSPEALTPLKKRAGDLGLAIRSIHFHKPLMNLDFQNCCRSLIRSIQVASEMEANLAVLHLPRLDRYQEALAHSSRVIDRILRIAEAQGLILTLENLAHHRCHQALEELLKTFSSPWLGVTLDLKFQKASGVDFQLFCASLGKYLVNVHINDYDGQLIDHTGRRHYPKLGQGLVNLAQVGETLDRIGYSGLFTLESSLSGCTDEVAELNRSRLLIDKYFCRVAAR